MAKKAKGGKPKPRAKKQKAAAAPRSRTTASSRSNPLPGMEQVRDRVLDNAHEQIAEGRSLMAQGRELEKEGIGIALQHMQETKQTHYKHAGIESVFVKGVNKIRVRMSKDAQDTASVDGNQDAADEVPF